MCRPDRRRGRRLTPSPSAQGDGGERSSPQSSSAPFTYPLRAAAGTAACCADALAAAPSCSKVDQQEPGASLQQGTANAAVGIRLMWVSVEARRQRIASKLLDCVRCQLMAGGVVPAAQLAFTQPTDSGIRFIQSYTGRQDFLMY